jgi:hypothetical protein
MKIFLLSCFSFFLSSFNTIDTSLIQSIKIDLVGIEYYSKSDCSEKSPIYVRIILKTSDQSYKKLKMILGYPQDITYTKALKEIDKAGNVVYSFCTGESSLQSFTITFIHENGIKSNTVKISPILKKDLIKNSRPLPLISLD